MSDRCSSKSMNECSKFACYLLQAVLELASRGGGGCSAFGCAVGDRCSSKSIHMCCKLYRMKKTMLELVSGGGGHCFTFGCLDAL